MGDIIQFPVARRQDQMLTKFDHEFDWAPLEQFFGADSPEIDAFEFIGRVNHPQRTDAVRMYKHFDTRRYLCLDSKGRTYISIGERFVKVSKQKALEDVYEGIDDVGLSCRGSLPRHEVFPCRRNSLTFVGGGQSAG